MDTLRSDFWADENCFIDTDEFKDYAAMIEAIVHHSETPVGTRQIHETLGPRQDPSRMDARRSRIAQIYRDHPRPGQQMAPQIRRQTGPAKGMERRQHVVAFRTQPTRPRKQIRRTRHNSLKSMLFKRRPQGRNTTQEKIDMKNTKEKTYTQEQHALIAELAATYGLEPDQIIFFGDDPKPLFDREATAILIHRLTDAVGIEDDLVPAPVGDAIAVKYRVTFADGSSAASTGMANMAEMLNGEIMSQEQLKSLATSRASRSALTNKGIDLLKLHNQAAHGKNVATLPVKSTRAKLIAQAHLLGQEAGMIVGVKTVNGPNQEDKSLWQGCLRGRYGVSNSNELSDELLSDFVAFLNSLVPQTRQKAA